MVARQPSSFHRRHHKATSMEDDREDRHLETNQCQLYHLNLTHFCHLQESIRQTINSTQITLLVDHRSRNIQRTWTGMSTCNQQLHAVIATAVNTHTPPIIQGSRTPADDRSTALTHRVTIGGLVMMVTGDDLMTASTVSMTET